MAASGSMLFFISSVLILSKKIKISVARIDIPIRPSRVVEAQVDIPIRSDGVDRDPINIPIQPDDVVYLSCV